MIGPTAVDSSGADLTRAERVVAELRRRSLSIALAESLTGGLLVAELVGVPGASAVVRGGVVAYDTALKHTLLGVDASRLALYGAVDPDVARQMASGVRRRLAVDGLPADVGLSTTGVAGPDSQDGKPVGTVYIGMSIGSESHVLELALSGSRNEIRRAVVDAALEGLLEQWRE